MSDIPLRDLRNLRAEAGTPLFPPATTHSLAPPPEKRIRHNIYADKSEGEGLFRSWGSSISRMSQEARCNYTHSALVASNEGSNTSTARRSPFHIHPITAARGVIVIRRPRHKVHCTESSQIPDDQFSPPLKLTPAQLFQLPAFLPRPHTQ